MDFKTGVSELTAVLKPVQLENLCTYLQLCLSKNHGKVFSSTSAKSISCSRFSRRSFSDGAILLLLGGPVTAGPFNKGLNERLLRFHSGWMAD